MRAKRMIVVVSSTVLAVAACSSSSQPAGGGGNGDGGGNDSGGDDGGGDGGGGSCPSADGGASPARIDFPGVGLGPGLGDPSLELDPSGSRVWMSYTGVEPPTATAILIQTHIAHSDDSGAHWTDDGLLTPARDVTLPNPPPQDKATWEQETSRLLADPWGAPSERWLIFWHRYIDINDQAALGEAWIAMKTAPAPLPLAGWSAEHKLFVSAAYSGAYDSEVGPPEVKLSDLSPDLAECYVVAEPGAMATQDAIYVSLDCHKDLTHGRVVLLRRPRTTGKWEYAGTLLRHEVDAPPLGFQGMTATDLEDVGGKHYLVVSPYGPVTLTDGGSKVFYLGCMMFPIDNLDTATLARKNGSLVPAAAVVPPKPNSFRGACGIEGTICGGLVYHEYFDDKPNSRLLMSFVRP